MSRYVFVCFSLSLHVFSCLLVSLSFYSLCFWFFFFWGSQSWCCLSCLSVTRQYTHQLWWLAAINSSKYMQDVEIFVSVPKSTLHLTLCLFLFTTTTFCAGRASQNWISGYGTLFFYFSVLKWFCKSHMIVPSFFSNQQLGLSLSICPFFSPAH